MTTAIIFVVAQKYYRIDSKSIHIPLLSEAIGNYQNCNSESRARHL